MWMIYELINMERLLNDTGNIKAKYTKEKVSSCLLIHHKSHLDYTGIEADLNVQRPKITPGEMTNEVERNI